MLLLPIDSGQILVHKTSTKCSFSINCNNKKSKVFKCPLTEYMNNKSQHIHGVEYYIAEPKQTSTKVTKWINFLHLH